MNGRRVGTNQELFEFLHELLPLAITGLLPVFTHGQPGHTFKIGMGQKNFVHQQRQAVAVQCSTPAFMLERRVHLVGGLMNKRLRANPYPC